MTLEYLFPNGSTNHIDIKAFILENDEEVFLLGFDYFTNQYTLLGVVEGDGKFYYYQVKQMSQKAYEKIIAAPNLSEHQIKSNISSGFWNDDLFIKKDGIPAKLEYFLSDAPAQIVQKGPYTHSQGKFMVPTKEYATIDSFTSIMYNLITLNKAI